jgi:NOL1/NOP2/fmu family ribosome biogenesis protein
MFVEQVFKQLIDNENQLRVLDLCAAPGGKSTHLSTLIGKNGLLVANEVIRPRASILTETLTKWGIGNVLVTQNDPSAFSRLESYFDVILVDAPCSGEGMFRDEVARNNWSEANANLCAERQKRILSDVWPALKENGLLIYCTCTFNPLENEKNIEWLIENKSAEIVLPNINGFPEITPIDYNGVKGYGFLPYKTKGEGFFISVLRKNEAAKSVKTGKVKATEFSPTDKEKNLIKNLLSVSDDNLLKVANEIWVLPCGYNDYNLLNQNLKIIKSGIKVATIKNNDAIPSHDLALSTGLLKNEFAEIELNYEEALAFLKRNTLNISTPKCDWIILKYKGVNLGWAKNIGSRINNYYPIEWRIRMDTTNADKSNIIKWHKV